jgi:hypothetical protein
MFDQGEAPFHGTSRIGRANKRVTASFEAVGQGDFQQHGVGARRFRAAGEIDVVRFPRDDAGRQIGGDVLPEPFQAVGSGRAGVETVPHHEVFHGRLQRKPFVHLRARLVAAQENVRQKRQDGRHGDGRKDNGGDDLDQREPRWTAAVHWTNPVKPVIRMPSLCAPLDNWMG